MYLVYLQNLCITIVFDFSWGDCNTQENLETMVTPFLGGAGWGGGDTRCIMVYVKIMNTNHISRLYQNYRNAYQFLTLFRSRQGT